MVWGNYNQWHLQKLPLQRDKLTNMACNGCLAIQEIATLIIIIITLPGGVVYYTNDQICTHINGSES